MAKAATIWARVTESPARDRRSATRHLLSLEVAAAFSEDGKGAATVHNLSSTGFSMWTPAAMSIGEWVDVELPHAGVQSARVVWIRGQRIGCEFNKPVSLAALSAARLKSSFETPANFAQSLGAATPAADRSDFGAGEPSQALLLVALVLALAVASVFILALLTLQFST